MLEKNQFGVEMNFAVVYRVTWCFIDNKKTFIITFAYISSPSKS